MKLSMVFKEITGKLFRSVQKILITVSLTLVYIFGLGLTLVLALLFNRKIIFSGRKAKNSSWRKAQGYQPDLKDCFRQS